MAKRFSKDELQERTVSVLRRDLKMVDKPMDRDTPLVESDLDLDSLDFLQIVVSIEREFACKIPNTRLGNEVFTNVGTLVDFLDDVLSDAESEAKETPSEDASEGA